MYCRFYAADTFGDGWDGAKLHIYDTRTYYDKVAPDCHNNPIVVQYCFDPSISKDGDVVSATVFGIDPDYVWEVIKFNYMHIYSYMYYSCDYI